jgi:hypothetical protein
MSSPPIVPSPEILWKQYELQVGLYKGYLDLLLKFNVFYYAATGALISYYFSKPDIPWMKYSLGFPVLTVFLWISAILMLIVAMCLLVAMCWIEFPSLARTP